MNESIQGTARRVYRAATRVAVLVGLIGASLAAATPTSAKFIGTRYYEPSVMFEMCQSDIDLGEAGFCTGYVIATQQQMAIAGEVCLPTDVEYEDMVGAVVRRIKYVLQRHLPVLDTRTQTEAALRLTWPCKK
jgi:hypothetical protein